MTPAIDAANNAGINHRIHHYHHEPTASGYGMEAAEKLGVDPQRVFKTLVALVDGRRLAVAVVPVTGQLSLKRLARAAGGKKAVMADPAQVQRSTGYVLGGVSALGQKKRLPTFIDASAEAFESIYISAGRRGLEIELAAGDLARLTQAGLTPLQNG